MIRECGRWYSVPIYCRFHRPYALAAGGNGQRASRGPFGNGWAAGIENADGSYDSRSVLVPASSAIPATATKKKDDDYDDQERCGVHNFSPVKSCGEPGFPIHLVASDQDDPRTPVSICAS